MVGINPYLTNEENPIKQLRKDLDAASPFRGRARRRKKAKSRLDLRTQPDFEEAKQLGIANQAYVDGRLAQAKEIVSRVITSSPHVFEAWRLLGQIAHDSEDLENCHTAWLYAAGLRERDGALWEEVAKVALELGRLDDADYAYTRACRARPKDAQLAYARLEVHLGQEGNEKQLIECYKALLKARPYDMTQIRELAKLYMECNKPVQAVELYEAAAKHWSTSLEPNAREQFTWNELNIMAELYDNAAAGDKRPMYWSSMIAQIKSLGSWLCGNEDDDGDDANSEETVFEQMPIDLHLWLAKAKLYIGQVKEGLKHVELIRTQGVDFQDLLHDTAKMLHEARQHKEALACFSPLLESGDYDSSEFYLEMATCALAVSALDQAQECLERAVDNDEQDVDAWVMLAVVYETQHQRPLAMNASDRVRQIRREQADISADNDEDDDDDGDDENDNEPAGPSTPRKKAKAKGKRAKKASGRARRNDQTAANYESAKCAEAEIKFGILNDLHDDMMLGPGEAFDQWLETALELLSDFRELPHLWSRSGGLRSAFSTKRDLADRVAVLSHLLEEENGMASRSTEQRAAEATVLRGQHVLAWLKLFMQASLCLEQVGRADEAIDVLDTALDASVFRQHEERLTPLIITKLLVALKSRHGKAAIEVVRVGVFRGSLHGDWLRFAMAAAGIGDRDCIRDDPIQKAFLRGLKTIDSAKDPTKDTGENQLLRDFKQDILADPPTSRSEAAFYVMYGNIMAASRNHIPALHYFVRAWETDRQAAKWDPMQAFQIGLAYLQRSMQRQTDNRQFQIVQAMCFFQKYYGMRASHPDAGVRQEGDFNMAKVYHFLGLPHLAVPLYEKVLRASDEGGVDPKYDLGSMAAFNLHLIYMQGGASKMARHVLHRYITI